MHAGKYRTCLVFVFLMLFFSSVPAIACDPSSWESLSAKGDKARRNYEEKFNKFSYLTYNFSVIGVILSQVKEIRSAHSEVLSAGADIEGIIASWKSISKECAKPVNRETALKNARGIAQEYHTNSETLEVINNRFEKRIRDFENMHGPVPSVVTLSNGDRYKGGIKDSKMHGWGTLKQKNGEVIVGKWRQGRLWDINSIYRCVNNCQEIECDCAPRYKKFKRRTITSPVANIYDSFRASEDDLSYQVGKYHPVNVLFEYKSFLKIEGLAGFGGWVHKQHVGDIPSVVVKSGPCLMRSGPSNTSEIIFEVDKGGAFKVLKHEGNWTHVEYSDGDRGWIQKKYLR